MEVFIVETSIYFIMNLLKLAYISIYRTVLLVLGFEEQYIICKKMYKDYLSILELGKSVLKSIDEDIELTAIEIQKNEFNMLLSDRNFLLEKIAFLIDNKSRIIDKQNNMQSLINQLPYYNLIKMDVSLEEQKWGKDLKH